MTTNLDLELKLTI